MYEASLPYKSRITITNSCEENLLSRSTKATQWGCAHESTAREHYFKVNSESHVGLCVTVSGFVINPKCRT